MIVRLVSGLRIDDVLLYAVEDGKSAGAARTLSDGCIEIPANAIVERESRRHFPRVLKPCAEVVAADGCWADVFPIGEVRWSKSNGINEWAAGEKAGKRIGKRVAWIQVVRATRGCDG